MGFFEVVEQLEQKGYQQLYLRSPYLMTTDDIYDASRWFEVAMYSGGVKLASMGDHHDEWDLALFLPCPSSIRPINIPQGCIVLDHMNLLTLGTTDW